MLPRTFLDPLICTLSNPLTGLVLEPVRSTLKVPWASLSTVPKRPRIFGLATNGRLLQICGIAGKESLLRHVDRSPTQHVIITDISGCQEMSMTISENSRSNGTTCFLLTRGQVLSVTLKERPMKPKMVNGQALPPRWFA